MNPDEQIKEKDLTIEQSIREIQCECEVIVSLERDVSALTEQIRLLEESKNASFVNRVKCILGREKE